MADFFNDPIRNVKLLRRAWKISRSFGFGLIDFIFSDGLFDVAEALGVEADNL